MSKSLVFPHTQILTKDSGWKDISMLMEGDKILSTTLDNEGKWVNVGSKQSTYYVGNISKRVSRSFTTLCADGGLVFNRCGSKLNYSLSENISKHHRLLGSCILDEGELHLSDLEIQLSAWLCTDSYFTKGNQVILYQRESNAHKITSILDALGIDYSYKLRIRDIKAIMGKVLKKPPENGVELTLGTASIEKLEVYSNKVLPEWCGELSKRQWDIFIETLIEADGSIPTKAVNSRVFYGRKEICYHLQGIAVTKGYSASITEYRPSHFRVNLVNNKMCRKQEGLPVIIDYNGVAYIIKAECDNVMAKIDEKPVFIAI
jgi:hypothetical protein